MSIEARIKDYVIRQYQLVNKDAIFDERRNHVLCNKEDNFLNYDSNRLNRSRFHIWAGSLKSSQAFAWNFFYGNPSAKFEYELKAINTPAQLDVAVQKDKVIDLFEVKMYEFMTNKPAKFEDAYFKDDCYSYLCNNIREKYIEFIREVVIKFGQEHYGEGLKQLSCHLLGILNECNGKLKDYSKINLYSVCYDYYEDSAFIKKLNSYKQDLSTFKTMIDGFLESLGLSNKIKYHGFLSASELKNEYIEKGLISIDCVKRYFNLKR